MYLTLLNGIKGGITMDSLESIYGYIFILFGLSDILYDFIHHKSWNINPAGPVLIGMGIEKLSLYYPIHIKSMSIFLIILPNLLYLYGLIIAFVRAILWWKSKKRN